MSFEVGPSGRAFTLVICDRCGRTEEYADGRVYAVADMATAQGWEIQSNDHAVCTDCVLAAFAESEDYEPDPLTFIDDPVEIKRRLDDLSEQISRDREIDIRISPSGELIDWDVLP